MKFDLSQYVDVQARISRFWSEYPQGRITTDILSDPNDRDWVVVVASVYQNRVTDEFPIVTGIAAEERGKTFSDGANFTSWTENAETSAIGRALANMGYATTGADRPSQSEMGKVNRGLDAIIAQRQLRQPTQS